MNAVDNDGKTALHHAAQGGKTRVIPILIQRGADIILRDKVLKKTALEMAVNDRTRELIIVYSSPPYKPSKEDREWMDTKAITSKGLPIMKETTSSKGFARQSQSQ